MAVTTVLLKLEGELLERVDSAVDAMQRGSYGAKVTRTEAVKAMIKRGAESILAEAKKRKEA